MAQATTAAPAGQELAHNQVMRIAIGNFPVASDERLTFAKQLGLNGVVLNTPQLPATQRWEYMDIPHEARRWEYLDLVELRTRCENHGLRLEAIENVPIDFYDKIMLGLPGRDEQLENYQAIIRNMGAAGIPILGYHWMPNTVWRTSFSTPGRGGADCTAFDMALVEHAPLTHGRVFDADEMWANYAYFMRAVMPVAEEAGVTLALHPDDPPVPMLGGIARLFGTRAGLERAFAIAPSANHGLDLCLGSWSETGEDVIETIEHFGALDRIVYVHFRDVQGTVPKFQECFLGEGNYDPVAVMLALKRTGFTGFILDDHTPRVVDDTLWCHRGRAHETGYLQGLLAAIERLA
ncbi:MAG: mannonate dehydratase [Thermomicrobiales bacterium]